MVVLCQKRTFGNTTAKLTSPSSPASAEVTAKSFPFASYAFISMPQLVSGCLNHTVSTCFTSILCQDVTPAFTSIFRDRIRMCLPPSVTGISRDICKKTVVTSSAGLRWTQSCAFTIRFAWIFGLKEKKQHFGFRSTWTMGSAEKKEEIVNQSDYTDLGYWFSVTVLLIKRSLKWRTDRLIEKKSVKFNF